MTPPNVSVAVLTLKSIPGLPATWLGYEIVVLLSISLCVIGVVGSVVPLLPGASLSLGGVGLYWWASGYTDPGLFAAVLLFGIGATALVIDFAGGAITAYTGGASLRTSLIAAAVALPLVLVAGPFGLLLGLTGTVFILEFRENQDLKTSARVAAFATVGLLATSVMQVLLTSIVLVGLVIVIVF
jgi:uncharacterized protein YqgC (DUF456 family)